MNTYTQLTIDGTQETKRIFKRDLIGQFASKNPTPEELLMRENFRLQNKVLDLEQEKEMWRRKHESLTKIVGHKKLTV